MDAEGHGFAREGDGVVDGDAHGFARDGDGDESWWEMKPQRFVGCVAVRVMRIRCKYKHVESPLPNMEHVTTAFLSHATPSMKSISIMRTPPLLHAESELRKTRAAVNRSPSGQRLPEHRNTLLSIVLLLDSASRNTGTPVLLIGARGCCF